MARRLLIQCAAFVAVLVPVSAAHATVVNVGGVRAGVATEPGDRGGPGSQTMAGPADLFAPFAVTSSASCSDPWLASDLRQPGASNLPPDALCYRGGHVLHANESFAVTWDAPFNKQVRHYWETTRGFEEQFLRDVADSSGKLGSPYDLTQQYQDAGGRAGHSSRYGGGCIDYGNAGGSTCRFPDQTTTNRGGRDYPAGPGCSPAGASYAPAALPNVVCLTDAQIQSELRQMYSDMGLKGRTQPGHTPLLVMLTPPQVEDCVDPLNRVCSANSSTAPPTPTVTVQPSGGTVDIGTYQVEITYLTGSGETPVSATQTVTTSTNESTITISSPPNFSNATGWYAYVTQAGGPDFIRQESGPPTPIGTSLLLSAPPANTGAAPPGDSVPMFCSYHSYLTLSDGTRVPYVVQPWTAFGRCDEPDVPPLTAQMTTVQVEQNAGMRLVSPLSQGQIAAITNPFLDGWSAADGSETSDNSASRVVDPFPPNPLVKVDRCTPLANQLDRVTVGSSSQNPYYLKREFNNAGAIQADLNSPQCAPGVELAPAFVVPSPIDAGDVVAFDGSVTDSTLMVPQAGYSWKFGDGSTATGASVEHTFKQAGNYAITLTVTDRGGNAATVSRSVEVLDHNGHPPGGGTGGGHAFRVRVQLMPQGLSSVLRRGLVVRVRSNQRADGFATLSISRRAARRAHLHTARSGSVVIARGTVSGVKSGTRTLHLRLSRASASRLRRLRHVTINLRLTLVGAHGSRVTVDAAGSY